MNLWRLINPFVALLARSPLHFLISHQLLVVSFKGIKSGKSYLIPVSYHKHDYNYTAVTLRSNVWWKNLKKGSTTQIWLKGKLVQADIQLEFVDNDLVADTLTDLVTNNSIDAFFAKIKLNKDGSPNQEDLTKAASLHTVLKFTV
jgi:hypothetical protein